MTRYGFAYNLDTCSDHRSCMLACKAKTRSFLGSHYTETATAIGGEYPHPNTYFIPLLCQQCAHPSCIPVCSLGVLSKRADGIVAVGNTAACEACVSKACVSACPFGAIDLDPVDGRIGKCDMCADLIDKGQVPACSTSCFTRSIFFGDLDDPESEFSQMLEVWKASGFAHQLRPKLQNKPAVYYLLSSKKWQDMDDLYSPAWKND